MPRPFYTEGAESYQKVSFFRLLESRVHMDHFDSGASSLDEYRVGGGFFVPDGRVGDFVRRATDLYRRTWVQPMLKRAREALGVRY